MTKFLKVVKVISDPIEVPETVCSDCVGKGTEMFIDVECPCETCDGTGKVKMVEVVAIVSVSSNTAYPWEV